MESISTLMGVALESGGVVLLLVAAIKMLSPKITGLVTLVPVLALSILFGWYQALEMMLPTPSMIILMVLIAGTAIGAWAGGTKIAGKVGEGMAKAGGNGGN